MRIPRFWASATGSAAAARGRPVPVKSFGWSDQTIDEARARAAESLGRLVDRIARGMPFPERYGYADRPVREEILSEVRAHDGAVVALVTRNAFGAAVLNTARVMFADIDDPPSPRRSVFAVIASWFTARPPMTSAAPRLPDAVSAFARAHPTWSMRCYRTFAGWRLLITHDLFDPRSDEVRDALTSLGSDPKYIELTRIQESFRARLSAKPWRCRVARPKRDFPRQSAVDEQAHATWLAAYETAGAGFATCEFIVALGRGVICQGARPIVDLHDRQTKATSGLPLA